MPHDDEGEERHNPDSVNQQQISLTQRQKP
jgi:hypothetical protein